MSTKHQNHWSKRWWCSTVALITVISSYIE